MTKEDEVRFSTMCAISMALKSPKLQQGDEWHKVAEGDLPSNSRYVWTNVGAGYYEDG